MGGFGGCIGEVGMLGRMLWCLIIYLSWRDLGGRCRGHGRGHSRLQRGWQNS